MEKQTKAVKDLFEFFVADMWYASRTEWKSEQDMLEYLKRHFELCLEEMKK